MNDTQDSDGEFPGFRNKRRDRFTMLANAMLRDAALSLKAKGLLSVMLSFPDDWRYYMRHLETLSTDGREAHQTAMKELIGAGYVNRRAYNDPETGQLDGWAYEVTDERENRPTGKPSDGKPATTNTDFTKTDNTNRKKHVISPDGEAREGGKPERRPPPTPDASLVSGQQRGKASNSNHDTALEKVPPGAAALLSLWNEHCGPLPRVKVLTPARVKALERLGQTLGEEAPALFADAVQEVARDPFWKERRYGLDNLLRDKVPSKAEAWRARKDRADASPLARRRYD